MNKAQPIKQLPSNEDWLILEAEFHQFNQAKLFNYFTNPKLLPLWWAPEAKFNTRVGGEYHLSWPSTGWHLRGNYIEFDPPDKISFTWNWDHEPYLPERTVTVNT